MFSATTPPKQNRKTPLQKLHPPPCAVCTANLTALRKGNAILGNPTNLCLVQVLTNNSRSIHKSFDLRVQGSPMSGPFWRTIRFAWVRSVTGPKRSEDFARRIRSVTIALAVRMICVCIVAFKNLWLYNLHPELSQRLSEVATQENARAR